MPLSPLQYGLSGQSLGIKDNNLLSWTVGHHQNLLNSIFVLLVEIKEHQ